MAGPRETRRGTQHVLSACAVVASDDSARLRLMEMQTMTAHRDGIDLVVQRSNSMGDPVLLIHGIGAEMMFWRDEFCRALGDQRFQVARFDNRDCGKSTALGSRCSESQANTPRDGGPAIPSRGHGG